MPVRRLTSRFASRATRLDRDAPSFCVTSVIRGALWVACGVCFCLTAATACAGDPFTAEDRDYWFWKPCLRPEVPEIAGANGHPIDALLLPRHAATGIVPAQLADRRTLIRRATFDLHGLPPSVDEVAAFLSDSSPGAYERVIDRLLASPRYGEHWARHWLDLVRYAESDGFKTDDLRPHAWRYRDYVIDAFNDDKPFDEFIIEQLAGDEVDGAGPATLVATGFLRLGPYEENGRNVGDQRSNILNDITDVTGQVFLGLTIGCARCHDHKYDPILQADYFRLQAFFAALDLSGDQPLATRGERAAHDERLASWQAATADAQRQLADLERPHRARILAERKSLFPAEVQAILETPVERRSPLETQMAALAARQLDISSEEVTKRLTAEDRARHSALRKEIQDARGGPPDPLPRAMLAHDIGTQAPPTIIPGNAEEQAVEPGFLSVLAPPLPTITPTSGGSTGRRLALARWIASSTNPLTPRVTVNRIWQQHFGEGLVASSGDFGRQGERPTDPRVLDWLASEWIANGFHMKPLHRLIMTSAAYQRTSLADPAGATQRDPGQSLLSRFPRRRLSGEQLRDALLAASGELNLPMHGPSVRSELPKNISAAYAWKPDPDASQRNRRSIYLLVRRNLREPLLDAFDMPDTHESCTRRLATTTAPQALFLMNGKWSLDRAVAMANRVLRLEPCDPAGAIRDAYQFAYQRDPDAEELTVARRFLERQRDGAGDAIETPKGDGGWAGALADLCHVLLNSNEFLYLD